LTVREIIQSRDIFLTGIFPVNIPGDIDMSEVFRELLAREENARRTEQLDTIWNWLDFMLGLTFIASDTELPTRITTYDRARYEDVVSDEPDGDVPNLDIADVIQSHGFEAIVGIGQVLMGLQSGEASPNDVREALARAGIDHDVSDEMITNIAKMSHAAAANPKLIARAAKVVEQNTKSE
jgi:hypothetical protein